MKKLDVSIKGLVRVIYLFVGLLVAFILPEIPFTQVFTSTVLAQPAFDGMTMPVVGLDPSTYTGVPNSFYSAVWRGSYSCGGGHKWPCPDDRKEGSGSHGGVDITAVNSSTDILAVANGIARIAFKDWRSGRRDGCPYAQAGNSVWGNYVVIEHEVPGIGKVFSVYAHLSVVRSEIEQGKQVLRGAVLGKAGTTGCSSGIHLHFQVDKDVKRSHPIGFKGDRKEIATTKDKVADLTFSPIVFIREHSVAFRSVNVYDNTRNGWNVLTKDPVTGGPDPIMGSVRLRPTSASDPTILLEISVSGAARDCTLTVQLVTTATGSNAGLPPDGNHSGIINNVGTLITNSAGSGAVSIVVDVRRLANVAPADQVTYAHADLEDRSQTCREPDGTLVEDNEYGASGKPPGSPLSVPLNIHWIQPASATGVVQSGSGDGSDSGR